MYSFMKAWCIYSPCFVSIKHLKTTNCYKFWGKKKNCLQIIVFKIYVQTRFVKKNISVQDRLKSPQASFKCKFLSCFSPPLNLLFVTLCLMCPPLSPRPCLWLFAKSPCHSCLGLRRTILLCSVKVWSISEWPSPKSLHWWGCCSLCACGENKGGQGWTLLK